MTARPFWPRTDRRLPFPPVRSGKGSRFRVSQKRHALGGTHFCAQSRGRNSSPLIFPWGQNLALNRALGLAASHTPSAKFPCRCPDRTHMSSGRDGFDDLFYPSPAAWTRASSCSNVYSRLNTSSISFLESLGGRPRASSRRYLRSAAPAVPDRPQSYRST